MDSGTTHAAMELVARVLLVRHLLQPRDGFAVPLCCAHFPQRRQSRRQAHVRIRSFGAGNDPWVGLALRAGEDFDDVRVVTP